MRFRAVRATRARPTTHPRSARTAVRGRTVTLAVLAVTASGLVMTACGSQNPPAPSYLRAMPRLASPGYRTRSWPGRMPPRPERKR